MNGPRLLAALGACIAASCAGPAPTPATRATTADPIEQACAELLDAPPERMTDALRATLALGREAAPKLAALLTKRPDAANVDAGLAALGTLGGADARATLREFLLARGPHAAAAALALAGCAEDSDRDELLAIVRDRLADPALRTACAATLLRLGTRAEIAEFVRGVLLAGTPHGRELEASLGLPRRPRWAFERYLLQRALVDAAGQDFGLDTDAPWDALKAAADRIDAWLRPTR